MAITQAQMRMFQRRRTTDIDRLAQEYKKNVRAMTGEYQSAFADYQAKTTEQMKPFEEQMAKYKTADLPAYEAAKLNYQQQLDAYNAQLNALKNDPGTPRQEKVYAGKTWYGKKKYTTTTVYDPKPAPTFDAKMPEVPNAPTAPTIEQFDSSQFDKRRQQLQTNLQREVGERRAGRMSAVSRKSLRPMLQGSK